MYITIFYKRFCGQLAGKLNDRNCLLLSHHFMLNINVKVHQELLPFVSDHCLCTQTLRSSITSVEIEYCQRGSDRFALSIDASFESMPVSTCARSVVDNI